MGNFCARTAEASGSISATATVWQAMPASWNAALSPAIPVQKLNVRSGGSLPSGGRMGLMLPVDVTLSVSCAVEHRISVAGLETLAGVTTFRNLAPRLPACWFLAAIRRSRAETARQRGSALAFDAKGSSAC